MLGPFSLLPSSLPSSVLTSFPHTFSLMATMRRDKEGTVHRIDQVQYSAKMFQNILFLLKSQRGVTVVH